MRNSSLTWGAILLLLGGLMLADAMGVRVNGVAPMSFFWPLALILFGGWMILGAASLKLTVPEGVSARIRVSQGVSDVKVDQARFPRSGDMYQSPDFETAANAIEMKIEAGAAEIRVQ